MLFTPHCLLHFENAAAEAKRLEFDDALSLNAMHANAHVTHGGMPVLLDLLSQMLYISCSTSFLQLSASCAADAAVFQTRELIRNLGHAI